MRACERATSIRLCVHYACMPVHECMLYPRISKRARAHRIASGRLEVESLGGAVGKLADEGRTSLVL